MPRQKKPPATSSTGQAGSVSQLVAKTNRWRDQYNPLRGLTVARAVSMLEAGERGEFADLQWVYRFIEKRNSTCRALVIRRRSALTKLDWDIKVVSELPEGATEAQAKAQAEALRSAYEQIDNLKAAIKHLALAEFRGFAHLQKHRTGEAVTHLEPLDQWNWVRNGLHGDWYWNAEADSTGHTSLGDTNRIGGGLAPEEFIIRECDMPIDEIAIFCFLRKNLSQKDWDAFVEIYGIPSGIVIQPPTIPPGKEDEFKDAAKSISEGAPGSLPHGSDYKPNDQPRGINPFKEHGKAQDEELVLAGTGGKLTMLTESGSGTLAGGAHQDTFDEIAEGEAAEISELLQQAIDAEVIETQFPGEPRLVYFELASQPSEDIKDIVENAAKLAAAGYLMDPAELSEKTGYSLTLKPQAGPSIGDLLMGQGDLQNRSSGSEATREKLVQSALESATGVEARWLGAVVPWFRDLVNRAERMTDEEFQREGVLFLEKARRQFPELFNRMDHEALAEALDRAMGAACVNGAISGYLKRKGV